MGARRAIARKLEHPRAERREHAPLANGWPRLCVERVEVVHHDRVGAPVARRALGVDDG